MTNTPNFNVYDVLEPIKCPINTAKDSNVGILVDIHDDTDSICKDLSGSDLDTIKKSEFDLVDLFQNIYVTPQHVKKRDVKREGDIDFIGSFDQTCDLKDESDAIKHNNNKPAILTEADIEELLKGTYEDIRQAKSLNYMDKETKNYSYPKTNEEKSAYTDNVVTQDKQDWTNGMNSGIKNVTNAEVIEFLNKSYKSEEKSETSSNNIIFKNKELKEKLDWIKSRKDLKEALINELLSTSGTGIDSNPNNQTISKVLIPPIREDGLETNNNRPQNSQTGSLKSALNINKVIGGFQETHNNVDLSVKNFNIKTNLEIPTVSRIGMPSTSKVNNTPKENITLLQTAKLDKKAYAKRHIKSDIEKIGYTKGPTLYEKSVVLPQILNNLAVRKEALIEEKKHKRRLILDFGKPTNACKCSSKPECSGALNVKSKDTVSSKKTVANSVQTEGKGSQNNEVKLNPIIAMENCNRERQLAHRVRSAFEKYILTGSYY